MASALRQRIGSWMLHWNCFVEIGHVEQHTTTGFTISAFETVIFDSLSSSAEFLMIHILGFRGNHHPITSVDWNHTGNLLASASISDTDVIVWEVDTGRCVPLKRIGVPCALLKWSPNSSRLCSSTIGNVFRVWNATNWVPERWTTLNGAIQSAAWSPCSSHLVFVVTNETILYRLCFVDDQLYQSKFTLTMTIELKSRVKNNIIFMIFFSRSNNGTQAIISHRRFFESELRTEWGGWHSAEHLLGSPWQVHRSFVQELAECGDIQHNHRPDYSQHFASVFRHRQQNGWWTCFIYLLQAESWEISTSYSHDWLVFRSHTICPDFVLKIVLFFLLLLNIHSIYFLKFVYWFCEAEIAFWSAFIYFPMSRNKMNQNKND